MTGDVEPRRGRYSAEKSCFLFKKERAERGRRGVCGRRRCPGPGAGRDRRRRRRRRRAAEDPQLESAAQRSPRAGGRREAERGAASPGFRQAAPSRAPGRKEACLRAGKGRGEAGRAKSPPKIETAGGNGGKHKGSQRRGAGARAPSVHAPESCGSGADWGGTGSAGLETGHASIQEVTCEHGSWQRL